MNCTSSTIPIFAAFILSVSGRSEEAPKIDPVSVDLPASEAPNPNHLEPIPAYDPNGYDQAVYRSLLGVEASDAWMIGKPSFSPEYAVILRHSRKVDDPFDVKIESQRWVLEYVEAKKQIWQWKELDGGRLVEGRRSFEGKDLELHIRVTEDLNKWSVEITPEMAEAILSAWEAVVERTRYSDDSYRGMDGITYQFYCRYGLFGEIWTPSTGVPRMLTELGHELCALVKADTRDRKTHIETSLRLANAILSSTTKPEQVADDQLPARVQLKAQ